MNPTDRQVQVREKPKSTPSEIQELKADIKALHARFGELTKKREVEHEQKAGTPKKSFSSVMECDVEALQKQVFQLQEQVSVLTVSHGTSVFKEGGKKEG